MRLHLPTLVWPDIELQLRGKLGIALGVAALSLVGGLLLAASRPGASVGPTFTHKIAGAAVDKGPPDDARPSGGASPVAAGSPAPNPPEAVSHGFVGHAVFAAATGHVVLRTATNVHDGPGLSGAVLRKAAAGEEFQVFGKSGRWVLVGDNAPEGWVLKGRISP